VPSVPFSTTGTAPESETWDWSADTSNAVLDDDNWARYKQAHAWYTPDDDPKKADFKLPHHKMSGGELVAVWHGVSNAVARLSQADIPDSEMKSVFDHLTKHYAQWDKDPPEWDRFLQIVHVRRKTRALSLPMNTTRAVILANRPKGVPLADDLPYIHQQMRTPINNPDQLYVFPSAISDQQVDSYFTRMTPLTLSNYAEGATRGVSVCDSHNHEQMPIGRSFLGQIANSADGGLQTQSLAYLIRGMQLPGGMRSDDYIQALEGGLYHDVSVGFDPSHYWCNICGCDMLSDWDCSHWPGQMYDRKDADPMQCVADVDATLVEYSPVYKASNPGAYVLPNGSNEPDGRGYMNVMVLKAQAEMERGRATNRDLMFVEDRCRVRLFQRFTGYSPKSVSTEGGTARAMPVTRPLTGAEFVAGVIRRAQAQATRAGKALSGDNLEKLQAIHTQLSVGHGSITDAVAAMADFITTNGGVTADPDNDGDIDVGPVGTTDDPDNDGITVGGDTTSGLYGVGASTSADGTQQLAAGAMNDGTNGSDTNNTTSGLYGGAPGTVEGGRSAKTQSRLTPAERDALNFAARMRDEAIAQALKSGARALGQSFNQERYQAILNRSTYDEIQALKADWDAITARNLSPIGTQSPNGVWSTEPTMRGGRQTNPQPPNDPVGLGTLTSGPAKTGRVNPNQYKA
jgi:hypothetical protein